MRVCAEILHTHPTLPVRFVHSLTLINWDCWLLKVDKVYLTFKEEQLPRECLSFVLLLFIQDKGFISQKYLQFYFSPLPTFLKDLAFWKLPSDREYSGAGTKDIFLIVPLWRFLFLSLMPQDILIPTEAETWLSVDLEHTKFNGICMKWKL